MTPEELEYVRALEKALGALLARADEHWAHKGSVWKEQDDARALLNNNPTVYDKETLQTS